VQLGSGRNGAPEIWGRICSLHALKGARLTALNAHTSAELVEGTMCFADPVQVLAFEHWQIGGVLLGVDCIFVATSFKFLDLAGSFDRDWHKTLTAYPGTSFQGPHSIPFHSIP
jgi:hypothetical protein